MKAEARVEEMRAALKLIEEITFTEHERRVISSQVMIIDWFLEV